MKPILQLEPPNQEIKTESESELNAWLALNPSKPFRILNLPHTLILEIFSWLDIPDLDLIKSTGHHLLINLANDSVLHQDRLRSVGRRCLIPYLINRPNRLDLVKRKTMRGLNLTNKIKSGTYLHSPTSIKSYETSQKLQKLILLNKLNKSLKSRLNFHQLSSLHLIDEEIQSRSVSNNLAPIIRLLKRERIKDQLAQKIRSHQLFKS
ncbi:hypothetical protein DFH28DRAFT_878944 [Melampsora americana]|nr:hypothetical protein DFH28DRAFT_878944 [Melampsora americana]